MQSYITKILWELIQNLCAFKTALNIRSRNSDLKLTVPVNPGKPLALHTDNNARVSHTLGIQTDRLETWL